MGSSFDMGAANALLKEYYDNQTVNDMVYKTNPGLALVRKMTDFGGKYYPVPIIFATSQGRSATFANAQQNQAPLQASEFLMTSKSDYAIATIDQRTMLSSATDKMAFVRGSKVFIDAAIRSITLSLATSFWRTGTGTLGRVSGSITAGVITLTNAMDSTQFEINMVLQSATTDGGTPRAAVGYVTAVDRTAGTVTVSATGLGGSPGTPSSWSANDYLLVQGDSNAKISGVQAWLPTSAPGSTDNFYGVNRSTDPVRLAGVRFDGSAETVEEAYIDASMLTGREGGVSDHAFANYQTYGALTKALGSKVQYVDLRNEEVDIGFRGIRIYGAHSEIKIIPDRSVPALTSFIFQWDTMTLGSLMEAPHISKYGDGLEMLRASNQDGSELRVVYYANVWCDAPGWNNVTVMPV